MHYQVNTLVGISNDLQQALLYTVTFAAGETIVTFNIPITDDDILEGNENFTLIINSSSLRHGLFCCTPSEFKATVTIVDNDCKIRNYVIHTCHKVTRM